jgi:hypothetical protein
MAAGRCNQRGPSGALARRWSSGASGAALVERRLGAALV